MSERNHYIDTRTFGDATVTVISEGTLRWAPSLQAPEADWRAAIPEADAQGAISLGINVVLVRIGRERVLIDPGCDDPDSLWQEEFAQRYEGVTRTPGLTQALAELEVSPDEVSHVLITHAHGDHFGGVTVERGPSLVARFPNARHFIGRADWEGNPDRDRRDSELSQSLGMIDRLRLLELVPEEREVVPGVTMIPAPGETPGHMVVRVRSGDAAFYYLGDLFHHACEVAHPGWVSPGRDREAMLASRLRLMHEAAPAAATVVFTHERFPPWGRIVADGEGYRWERG